MGKIQPRIRGTTLQNIRSEHFRRHPLCVMCMAKTPSRVTAAVELDHIKPLHQGGKDTPDNRQGLCAECHIEKSKAERGHEYRRKAEVDPDGWPVAE
jgi:5-methylcytosine-specific restriction protein A